MRLLEDIARRFGVRREMESTSTLEQVERRIQQVQQANASLSQLRSFIDAALGQMDDGLLVVNALGRVVRHMVDTGFINTMREIWWDVRPHHKFGTVELRVCDMPGNLEDVLAIAALAQCLVQTLSMHIDEGAYQHDCHPMMVRQNKWRACRFGNQAQLVNSYTYDVQPVGTIVEAENLKDKIFKKVVVEPAATFDFNETVFVVIPLAVPGPNSGGDR